MPETYKEFEALYKKCKPVTKKVVDEAETYAKQLKYFRFDMNNALDALEERVLDVKASSEEPIKAKKIEDFPDKESAVLLKAVKWNLDKMLSAYKELDKMEKDAGLGKPNLKALLSLQDEFAKAKDLKKKRKEGKLDSNILKLESKVNDDLEQIMNFWDVLEKTNNFRREDPQKVYNARVLSIIKAKPKLSPRTQKYLELAPKMLHKKALQRVVSKCQLAAKTVNEEAKKAVAAAQKQDNKKLIDSITAGDKQLKIIEKDEEIYLKIQGKYSKEISKSDGKAAIEKAIKSIGKIKQQANKRWDDVKLEISKIKKAEGNA